MGGGIEGNPFLMRKVPFCCPMGMFLGARSGFKHLTPGRDMIFGFSAGA